MAAVLTECQRALRSLMLAQRRSVLGGLLEWHWFEIEHPIPDERAFVEGGQPL